MNAPVLVGPKSPECFRVELTSSTQDLSVVSSAQFEIFLSENPYEPIRMVGSVIEQQTPTKLVMRHDFVEGQFVNDEKYVVVVHLFTGSGFLRRVEADGLLDLYRPGRKTTL